MGIAMAGEEVRRKDDGIVQWRKALRPRDGEPVDGGIRSTAVSGAQQGGSESLKGEDRDVLVGDTGRLRDQFQNVGDLLAEVRRRRRASVEEDGEFQFRPVGRAKALKIADDVALVNDCEVAHLQGGHPVVVLVKGRKAELNLADGGVEANGCIAVGAQGDTAEQQGQKQEGAATG